MDAQCRLFEKLLGELAPDEVVAFQRAFDDRMREACRWDLWGAACIIEEGCSDDGFTDFRSWLISMGRDVFESALRDPESLVDVASADGVEVCSFEEFQYIPGQVYEELTHEELPDGDDAAHAIRLETIGSRKIYRRSFRGSGSDTAMADTELQADSRAATAVQEAQYSRHIHFTYIPVPDPHQSRWRSWTACVRWPPHWSVGWNP